MASIPQSVHVRNTYQYAASMMRAGKSARTIKDALITDGLSEDRAQAVLDNLNQVKRSSLYDFVWLHPVFSRLESRLRHFLKRK